MRTVFCPVECFLSGKAYARAVRGHMLANAALHTLFLHAFVNNAQAVPSEIPQTPV